MSINKVCKAAPEQECKLEMDSDCLQCPHCATIVHMKAEGKHNTNPATKHSWASLCGELTKGDAISDSWAIVNCAECNELKYKSC